MYWSPFHSHVFQRPWLCRESVTGEYYIAIFNRREVAHWQCKDVVVQIVANAIIILSHTTNLDRDISLQLLEVY
jgi:hypothetical protein